MESSLETLVLELVRRPGYTPLKIKALARKLKLNEEQYPDLQRTLKLLSKRGLIEVGKNRCIRPPIQRGEMLGYFKRLRSGAGIVRTKSVLGAASKEVFIRPPYTKDAVTGDLVKISMGRNSRTDRGPSGKILEVVERAATQFVGTLEEKDGEYFVRIDGGTIVEPIYIADANVTSARPGDKIVVDMVRFPSKTQFGEAAVTEVLGKAGDPGVDIAAAIRRFQLPDEFSDEALAEAREQARLHQDEVVGPDRLNLVDTTIITIDPDDAKDFDDAISISLDARGHWKLSVHIADVAHFVPPNTELDREARRRGTSVYLPGTVLPMLPEVISNGLASLQQDRLRFTKSVFVEFDPSGRILATSFHNSAIKVARRLTYREVQQYFDEVDRDGSSSRFEKEIASTLDHARELARILRGRRRAKGMLELAMPEAELLYDPNGRITGCRYAHQMESQRLIEEFMLTANEVVAERLNDSGAAFLRRVHPHPDPMKLAVFAQFARSLDLVIEDEMSRFSLQRVLLETRDDPRGQAVHYALLRSLKEAHYGPEEEGHYALASKQYTHFTSPIRRYPDLTIHRLLDRLIRKGKTGGDEAELVSLGEHCSFTERRATKAEREVVRGRLLEYMSQRVGDTIPMIVTGVEEFGLFCQGVDVPAEGLLHVRWLPSDFYSLDRSTQSLVGRGERNRFRLGDVLQCVIERVDLVGRLLDLRLADQQEMPTRKKKTAKPPTRAGKEPKKPKKPKKRAVKKARRKRK